MGPVITDDYFYLPEMSPEEYYKAYAPDSLLSEGELAVKYGMDMGKKTDIVMYSMTMNMTPNLVI